MVVTAGGFAPLGSWVLKSSTVEEAAVWGRGSEVLLARGEPLLVVGPDGVGKSTIAQRLTNAIIGAGEPSLIGLPVLPLEEGRALYVAADRPGQIRRSWKRMIGETEATILDERAVVWPRPLPFDLSREAPDRLAAWTRETGAALVVLDSLSALAADLSETKTGGAIAASLNAAAADGLQVVALAHSRKRVRDERGRRPRLDDVFGSRIVTTACGSVVFLDGEPGDPLVRLWHLKQPGAEVGPFDIAIDHDTGTLETAGGDLLAALRAAPNGLTAADAAALVTGKSEGARVRKAERALGRLVDRRLAHRREGERIRGAVRSPSHYFATAIDDRHRFAFPQVRTSDNDRHESTVDTTSDNDRQESEFPQVRASDTASNNDRQPTDDTRPDPFRGSGVSSLTASEPVDEVAWRRHQLATDEEPERDEAAALERVKRILGAREIDHG